MKYCGDVEIEDGVFKLEFSEFIVRDNNEIAFECVGIDEHGKFSSNGIGRLDIDNNDYKARINIDLNYQSYNEEEPQTAWIVFSLIRENKDSTCSIIGRWIESNEAGEADEDSAWSFKAKLHNYELLL